LVSKLWALATSLQVTPIARKLLPSIEPCLGVSNRPAGDLLTSTSGKSPAIDPTVNTTGSAVPKTNPVIKPLIAKWVRVIMVLEIDNYYKILVNHSYSE
jgi:hypothetical protein